MGVTSLPSFITNVEVEREFDGEDVNDTVDWHEVDDDVAPSDGIARRSVQVDIAPPDVVQILWRHDGDEQVLDETRNLD